MPQQHAVGGGDAAAYGYAFDRDAGTEDYLRRVCEGTGTSISDGEPCDGLLSSSDAHRAEPDAGTLQDSSTKKCPMPGRDA